MSTCRSCDTELRWAESTASGKPVPLEGPAENGTVRILEDGRAETLGPLEVEIARAEGTPLYLNHFATCPEREFWLGRTRAEVSAE